MPSQNLSLEIRGQRTHKETEGNAGNAVGRPQVWAETTSNSVASRINRRMKDGLFEHVKLFRLVVSRFRLVGRRLTRHARLFVSSEVF